MPEMEAKNNQFRLVLVHLMGAELLHCPNIRLEMGRTDNHLSCESSWRDQKIRPPTA